AECARWMGDLELLNGNAGAAAAHYLASADVCCRWAALDPEDPEPRVRMADSLIFAAQALKQAGQNDRVEARYRDALALLEAVVDRHPRVEQYQSRLVRAYGPLFELYREQQRWADGLELCRTWIDRARALIYRVGPKLEYQLHLARVQQCLGQMLDRTGKADEAECHLLEALAIRERLRKQTPEQ